jgi:hypothetical protein
MNVIRHDNVPTYRPAVAPVSGAPFFREDLSCFISSENRFSIIDARGDVIDREIDPYAFESPQMFMHSDGCSRGR